jgi:hypothetical protein
VRFGRLVIAAVAGGLAGGAAAGLGARLVMFVMRLMNPSHDGEVTHAGAEVGRWTLEGTVALVMEGMVVGALGGALYLVVRPALPGTSFARGLFYGLFLLAVFGGVVLNGDYEYFRFVSTWIAVAMFAALYPLYGVVVAATADRLAPSRGRTGTRGAKRLAGAALLLVTTVAAAASARNVYLVYFD